MCPIFTFFSVSFIAQATRFCSSSLTGVTVFAPPRARRGLNKPQAGRPELQEYGARDWGYLSVQPSVKEMSALFSEASEQE